MKVSPGWKARHASMIPLFAETQTSSASSSLGLISLTQSSDEVDAGNPRVLQATQQYLFSATQAPRGGTTTDDTYNWMTGATLDMAGIEMEHDRTRVPISVGSSHGLLFSSSEDMSRFKRKGLGNSRMKPANDDNTLSRKVDLETQVLRRRFVTNQDREKQTIYFARQEERRRKLRVQIETERKLRREAQVTMFRQYRVGELPDVQIPHKAIIAPLQALAEKDETTASQVFQILFDSILTKASDLLPPTQEDEWRIDVYSSLRNILSSSHFCHSHVIRPLLQLAMSKDISINPGIVSAVCTGSNLEPLGILTLERQLLVLNKSSKDDSCPPRKKQKLANQDAATNVTDHWLNIADLYKSMSMWDSVLGILKCYRWHKD